MRNALLTSYLFDAGVCHFICKDLQIIVSITRCESPNDEQHEEEGSFHPVPTSSKISHKHRHSHSSKLEPVSPIRSVLHRHRNSFSTKSVFYQENEKITTPEIKTPKQVKKPKNQKLSSEYQCMVRTKADDISISFQSKSNNPITLLKKFKKQTLNLNINNAKFKPVKESNQLELHNNLIAFELKNEAIYATKKIGILYLKEDQQTEDEWFSNQEGSPAFNYFLATLGKKHVLEGYTGYKGGLDVKTNTTGTHSISAIFSGVQIMVKNSLCAQSHG